MTKNEIAFVFARSFSEASSNLKVQVFSNCIRFIAITLVILAVMWAINNVMTQEQKELDGFLIRLGSRLVRLVIGLMVFVLLLNI